MSESFSREQIEGLLAELSKSKEALEWSEAKFTAVFEQAPFSIQIFAMDGKVLLFNKTSQLLWGISEDFVKSFILKDYCVFEDPLLIKQGVVEAVKKAFQGEVVELAAFKYDPAAIGKPGRYRWVESILYPLRDLKGQVRSVVLIHNDITEKQEAEEERDKLMQELINERNRLEDFISIASHELKTPLTSLSLQMEAIKMITKSPMDEMDLKALLKFSSSSLYQLERLSRLVDEMLDISRISAGKLELNLKKTELSELTLEVISRFADQLRELNIQLDAQEVSPVFVHCDSFRLEQVITNLLSNAIRYGEKRPIKVVLKQVGETALLEVRDQGPGIAKEDHKKIFDRFERVGPTNGISGLGLGLFISREIMQELNGKIYVQSELGEGASFFLELPVC